MNAFPAFAINLWLAGIPVVCITAAAVVLLRGAPARVRYVAALSGFALVILVPLFLTPEAAPAVATRAPESAAGSSFDVAIGAIVFWLAGSLFLVAREIRAYARLYLEERTWLPAGPIAMNRSEFNVVLAKDGTPRTHGLLRPVIVLPESLVSAEEEIVRLVVAHEESHARWRDPMIHAAIRLIRSLLWIALPLWIAERIVIREREAAADEAALMTETGETRSRYAEAIVEFCRMPPQRSALAVQIGAAADLEYRVRRILRTSSGVGSTLTALGLICAGFFLFAFTPLAEIPAEVVVEIAIVRDARDAAAVRRNAEVRAATRVEATTAMKEGLEIVEARQPRSETAPGGAMIVTMARSVAEVSSAAEAFESVVDESAEGPSPLAPLPPGKGKELLPVPVVMPHPDDEVIVIRNGQRHRHVVKRDGDRRDDAATVGTGRSRHPVALVHRGVTAPIKRLVRRARGTG